MAERYKRMPAYLALALMPFQREACHFHYLFVRDHCGGGL